MSYLTADLNASHPSFHNGTIKSALAANGYAPISRRWRAFYNNGLGDLMLFTSYWGWAEKDGVPMPVVIDIREKAVRENQTENKDAQDVWTELGRESLAPP